MGAMSFHATFWLSESEPSEPSAVTVISSSVLAVVVFSPPKVLVGMRTEKLMATKRKATKRERSVFFVWFGAGLCMVFLSKR